MTILLINIDSTIPNLALKKIEKYHKDKGDKVIWDYPLAINSCDKTYVSCIFPENIDKAREYEGRALIGGSGYDISIKLPPEINNVKPRINWGFTTRGCIRNCPFCFVPKMEGGIRVVGDIYDIWDGKSKELFIMDNNILAVPEHFKTICRQIREEKIKVDFNQGLDHRLLTPSLWKEIKSIKHIREKRFAFDNINEEPTVMKALDIMRDGGLKDWETRWYIYIGENDNFKTVYNRMILLHEHKQACYVMRDKKVYNNPLWIAISSWGNTMGAFKMDLFDLLDRSKRMKKYKKIILKELRDNNYRGIDDKSSL